MNTIRKTRFFILWSLVFYFLFADCNEKKNSGSVSIQWEGNKAVAVIVPQKFLASVSRDSLQQLLHIRLTNSDQSIIGEYSYKEDVVIFRPVIPFTRGLKYKLYVRNELIDEIEIQTLNSAIAPEIVTVYPMLDTLPGNLLKFYILFSKPMQEGDVLKYIHLIKDGQDTLSSVFLDMELWNNERTMLTLWLDPGRIKRDLQPNKLLGPPLSKGSHYRLVIGKEWQDAEGVLLKEGFAKNFFAGPNDNISPNEQLWSIDIPKTESKEQLIVNFHESLDHILAERTVSVYEANGNEVKGKFGVNDNATLAYFSPDIEWKKGIHILQIESRLEDLAGNNLDRLFDADLTQKQQPSKNIHKRSFEIK